MTNDKGTGKFSKGFSRHITKFIYVLLALFLVSAVVCYILDRTIFCANSFILFLKNWQEIFLTVSVCIWGFTLSCAIFLMGRLEEIYYGISLKRIILMCFGQGIIMIYVFIYIWLIPVMIISCYYKMWFVNFWAHVVNYVYSVGFILFFSAINCRSIVIELIRYRTIKKLRKKDFDQYLYIDEQLAVLNMIRNLDYDDTWQCDRLQSIIVDMILVATDRKRLYAVYNAIHLIIQQAGYETREQKNRIVNMICDIDGEIARREMDQGIEDRKIKEAIAGTIIPILQVDITEKRGKWISELIKGILWSMQRDVGIILMFAAEYLYECDTYCELTVNELLDTYLESYLLPEISIEEEKNLKNIIQDCWLNLNIYNRQGVQNDQICENFINDYININTTLCRTKILRDLQARKLSK